MAAANQKNAKTYIGESLSQPEEARSEENPAHMGPSAPGAPSPRGVSVERERQHHCFGDIGIDTSSNMLFITKRLKHDMTTVP